MEHASALQGLSLPENLRKGQQQIIDKFINGQERVIAKLPTGYGKTLAAVCSYAALRHQGVVNRLLYIVPRKNQANQALETPGDLKELFGIETRAMVVSESPVVAIRRHRENTGEIFIATIQSLCNGSAKFAVTEMMQTGRWFMVIDEHHHYSAEGRWSEIINGLSHQRLLAMSATPQATGTDYFSVPDVQVNYIDACRKEGAVKELHLHEYEYVVDAYKPDTDEIFSFTTGDLFREVGSELPDAIDDFMARRRMRWSPKYIDPLIDIPASRLADLRLRGVRSQMVVQAMSCSHAQMVCTQIKAMLPTMNVDWVGTGPNGRSDKENEAIIAKFCPKKVNGRRPWTLDVLVNVGMAGEGLDSVDVTEVSILTPANINNSLLQLIGRAARRMTVPDGAEQPVACINCDTDSRLAENDIYVGRKIMAVFDDDVDPDEITNDESLSRDDDYNEIPEEMQVYVSDVRLIDIRKDPDYEEAMKAATEADSGYRTKQQIEQIVEALLVRRRKERNEALATESTLSQMKDQINQAVGKIAGLVFRRVSETGIRVEKSLIGDIKKKINTRKKYEFGPIDALDENERRGQYQWLKSLEQQILLTHGLSGVPKWLR